jgi:hypothetical protein
MNRITDAMIWQAKNKFIFLAIIVDIPTTFCYALFVY